MSILRALQSADSLSQSFTVLATKAAGSMGGSSSPAGPYGGAANVSGAPFQDARDLANAGKQYGALRDIPYTAIRPIAVKIASQEIMLGYKASKKLAPDARKLRTKSDTYQLAPAFLQKKIAEGMDPIEDHELLDIFESPNPTMTGWALRYCTGMSIMATGDGYWLMDFAPGDNSGPRKPTAFWYLPKTWVSPVHDPYPFASYKVRPPGTPADGEITVPASDMMHFRFPNPADPLGSMSPMQAQARAINTDDEIQKAQFAAMRNGINPSVILRAGRLETPPGASGQGPLPVLTPEQRRQLIDTIRLHYSGATHFGDPIIVDGMIEGVEKFSQSPAELDFINGSALTKDRIMQGIGTSPVVAGFTENANRAGSQVAHEIFYSIVVNPILTLMSATLTAKLAPTDSAAGRKLYIWIEEARAKDADLELAKMTAAQQAQAITKNEWREFCGLPKTKNPKDDEPPEPLPPAGSPAGVNPTKPKPPKPKSASTPRKKSQK